MILDEQLLVLGASVGGMAEVARVFGVTRSEPDSPAQSSGLTDGL